MDLATLDPALLDSYISYKRIMLIIYYIFSLFLIFGVPLIIRYVLPSYRDIETRPALFLCKRVNYNWDSDTLLGITLLTALSAFSGLLLVMNNMSDLIQIFVDPDLYIKLKELC